MADEADYKYEISAPRGADGNVHLTIDMVDNVDGVVKTVDCGAFPDHGEAAEAATAFVATDLGTFGDFGGARKP